MVLPPKIVHPNGELEINLKKREIAGLVADTFDGKIHIEWDPQAQVTPLGQLPFFIQYLKVGHLFEPWVADCPLSYASSNYSPYFIQEFVHKMNSGNLPSKSIASAVVADTSFFRQVDR